MVRTTGRWVVHEDGTRSWWVTVLPPEADEQDTEADDGDE
jgi:hypothetical protein